MATSRWYSEFSKGLTAQRNLHQRLEAAWVEYETTLGWLKLERETNAEYLEEVAKKHGVSRLDVLEWRNDQLEDGWD